MQRFTPLWLLVLASSFPARAELRLSAPGPGAPSRMTLVTPAPWKAAARVGGDGSLIVTFQLPLVQKTEAMSIEADGRLAVSAERGRVTFRPFELDGEAHHLMVTPGLQGVSGARVEARSRPGDAGGEARLWSAWSPVSPAAGYWVPGGAAASAFQLRITFPETEGGARLTGLTLAPRNVPGRRPEAGSSGRREREPGERADRARGPVSTRVVSRRGWGARGMRNPGDPEWDQPEIKGIVVHHSVIPCVEDFHARGGIDLMRSIQRSHMDDRGWRDIAYHYLITPDGVLYEGVPEKVEGSHMRVDCNGYVAVCLIGNCDLRSDFDQAKAGRRRLWTLVARLCKKYGIDPRAVKGHQDFQPDRDCPGTWLYQELRTFRRKPAAVM